MKHSTAYRSEMAKAKGLGSAKSGVHHWLLQRITAIALVPLVVWAVSQFLASLVGENSASLNAVFASPLHALLGMVFLATALYHGALGFSVVCEDYIRCSITRNILIISSKLFAVLSACAGILGILRLHFLGA